MTSWLAEVDPGSSPDASSEVEEGSNTPGTGAEPRSRPEIPDGPVRPRCDCQFPVHQFNVEDIWRTVKRKTNNADTPAANLRE